MFHSTGLISTFALVTLFAFTSALSRPTSNDSDQKLIASVYQALGFQEKSPVTPNLQSSDIKAGPTIVTLEDELNTFTSDFHDENKQTSEPSYFQTTTTEGIPHSTPQENSDALLEEINKFMQQPDLEDVLKEKSKDISLTNKARSHSNVDNFASASEKPRNPQPSKVSLGASTPVSSLKPSLSTPKVSTSESSLDENDDAYKNDAAVEVTSVQEKNSKLIDTKIILIIGASAAGLLVVLMVVILVYLSRPKSPKSKGMYLNSDLNRWDPHLLRPSQKSVDSFIFGTPIPSVSEMIKAQDDVEIVIKGTTY